MHAGEPEDQFGSPEHFSRERWFFPRFTGVVRLFAVPADHVERLARRVQEGFLLRGHHARGDYVAQRIGADAVRITAKGFWTATNIGLNEVVLRRKDARHIAYEVRFARWTRYCVLLGASILAIGSVLYWALAFTSRPIGMHASSWKIGLPIALFFTLCWPWILTERHKKPAARYLERILRETLENE